MRLSTRTRYALRAVAELASRGTGRNEDVKPIPLGDLARRQGIPEQYLRQIFLILKRAGLVQAVRGKSGGYLLGRAPDKITSLDVIEAMGEKIEPVFCVEDPTQCTRASVCPTHALWRELADTVRDTLSATTVAGLAEAGFRPGVPAS